MNSRILAKIKFSRKFPDLQYYLFCVGIDHVILEFAVKEYMYILI